MFVGFNVVFHCCGVLATEMAILLGINLGSFTCHNFDMDLARPGPSQPNVENGKIGLSVWPSDSTITLGLNAFKVRPEFGKQMRSASNFR